MKLSRTTSSTGEFDITGLTLDELITIRYHLRRAYDMQISVARLDAKLAKQNGTPPTGELKELERLRKLSDALEAANKDML